MNCKVVHLEPQGTGGLRAPLRSDTLWGTLCWAIRLLYGEDKLVKIINAYNQPDNKMAFFLSSAFPYIEEIEKGDAPYRSYFLPGPTMPTALTEDFDLPQDGALDKQALIKREMRKRKAAFRRLVYCPQSYFENYIAKGRKGDLSTKPPTLIAKSMTHNTIDRLKGGTLMLGESGQLYNTNEFFLKKDDRKKKDQNDTVRTSGWYFLLQAEEANNGGSLEIVTGALRFLSHFGIGGDRSIGKGRFQISEPTEFKLRTPADANACMSLSLYRPTEAELEQFLKPDRKHLMHYKIEDRLGRTQWGGIRQETDRQKADGLNRFMHPRALLFFSEGSVVPLLNPAQTVLGQNTVVGQHSDGFDIHRYGYGFMVPIKIPQT